MDKIYELEIWSAPNISYSDTLSNVAALKKTLGAEDLADIVKFTDIIPDETDSENLEYALNQGELEIEEFEKFCIQNSLEVDLSSRESACKFLAEKYGACIAWVHLPHNDGGLGSYTRIINVIDNGSYQLVNSDKLVCLVPCWNQTKPLDW
jgi:hypothetical protein